MLRVPPCLHGMPRACLRRHRRLSGRGAVLRVRARHLEQDDSRNRHRKVAGMTLVTANRCGARLSIQGHGSTHRHTTELTTENDGHPPRARRVGHDAGSAGHRRNRCAAVRHQRWRARAFHRCRNVAVLAAHANRSLARDLRHQGTDPARARVRAPSDDRHRLARRSQRCGAAMERAQCRTVAYRCGCGARIREFRPR